MLAKFFVYPVYANVGTHKILFPHSLALRHIINFYLIKVVITELRLGVMRVAILLVTFD